MNNKITRKCIVTNLIKPTSELYRFTKYQNNITFDPLHKAPGRGAYVSKNETELEILFTRKLLNRAFRSNISNEVYNKLKEDVRQYGEKNKKE